jgi:hypothetical protein
MIQLPLLLLLLALLYLTHAQQVALDTPLSPPPIKNFLFSDECYETFFGRNEWLHPECIKRV